MLISYGFIFIKGTNEQEVSKTIRLWYENHKTWIPNQSTIKLKTDESENFIVDFNRGCELNHLVSLFEYLNYEFHDSNLQIEGFFMNEKEFMLPKRAYTLYFELNKSLMDNVIAVSEMGRNYRIKGSGILHSSNTNFPYTGLPQFSTLLELETIIAKDYESNFPFSFNIKTSVLFKIGFFSVFIMNLYGHLLATSFHFIYIFSGLMLIGFMIHEGFVKTSKNFMISMVLALLMLLSGIIMIYSVDAFKWLSQYEMLIFPSVFLLVKRSFGIAFASLFQTEPNFYFDSKSPFPIYPLILALFTYILCKIFLVFFEILF